MSDLSFINYLMLRDEERGTKAEQRLGDLREQAQAIARRTGREPLTFLEFSTLLQPEPPKGTSANTGLVGAVIGGGIFAAIAGLLSRSAARAAEWGIFGIFTGGAVGIFSGETKNNNRANLIDDYAGYLGQFAVGNIPGPSKGESYGQYLVGNYDKGPSPRVTQAASFAPLIDPTSKTISHT